MFLLLKLARFVTIQEQSDIQKRILSFFEQKNDVEQLYIQLSNLYAWLYFERYTIIENGSVNTILLVNERAADDNLMLVDPEYLTALKNNVTKVISLHSVTEWSSYFNDFSPLAIYSCYQRVKEYSENIIVEGFNDAVAPEPRILSDTTTIIGVAPGSVVFYDPIEFKKVIRNLTDLGKNPRALRAADVVKFLKEYKVIKLPAVTPESLADYDKLSKKLDFLVDDIKSMSYKSE